MSKNMKVAVNAQGMTKIYPPGRKRPPLKAVDGLDFTVRQGEVFGFLGPNGAGKTTTIGMLAGFALALFVLAVHILARRVD